MTFYNSEYLQIFYDPENKLVETRWLQFAPSKEYRKSLYHYLEVLRQHEVKLWLGDYRLAKVIRLQDQEWAAQEWFPLFIPLAGSLQKMARVTSIDAFAQQSSENMQKELDISRLPFLFKEYDDYDLAKAWLVYAN